MEKKLIALIFIAVLGGLGGGYGLGYVIYQPQIQNLQGDLGNLNDRLDTLNSTLTNTQSSVTSLQSQQDSMNSTIGIMENRTWHEASSLKGSSDVIGGNFQIKGKWMRIRWYMAGSTSSAWIQIIIRHSNGTIYAERGSSGIYGSYACDIAYSNLPGEYYIEVKTYSLTDYLVVVWDYY